MAARKLVTLRVDDELWDCFRLVCKQDGVTTSDGLRRLMRAVVEDQIAVPVNPGDGGRVLPLRRP